MVERPEFWMLRSVLSGDRLESTPGISTRISPTSTVPDSSISSVVKIWVGIAVVALERRMREPVTTIVSSLEACVSAEASCAIAAPPSSMAAADTPPISMARPVVHAVRLPKLIRNPLVFRTVPSTARSVGRGGDTQGGASGTRAVTNFEKKMPPGYQRARTPA